jgi:hypothetical protein
VESAITTLGDDPFAKDAGGKPKVRIGTAFPKGRAIVTLSGIHATQRQAYIAYLNEQRQLGGRELLSKQEEHAEWNGAVDLIFEDDAILIRPDPDNMALAFEADELLQGRAPKHRIKFLGLLNNNVRDAIKERGELWRITSLPKSLNEMKQMIRESQIGIGGKEIYYYSTTTGVRFLTYQRFAELGKQDESSLRSYLLEIRDYSIQTNALGYPELDFFATDKSFSRADFVCHDFRALEQSELRSVFETLREKFMVSVIPELREDDPENVEWRNCMVGALIGQEGETVSEETLLGLSPEFFMQIEWLPGGCIEDGELVLDPILDEAARMDDEELKRFCDEKPQKFIFNFVREHGNLEYVNIGRVVGSLSRRPAFYGRRGVYIAVVKLRGSAREIVSIIRMQKYGVREYLDERRPLLDSMLRSEEYTEYILDRRLGCRQLGMNLPTQVAAKRISEHYARQGDCGFVIWSPYFERSYIRGIATDKVPPCRFENQDFALQFARLLGRAAAPNVIVGRCDRIGNPLFDDGDEVLIEDSARMPVEIVVADHTGTFNDYLNKLEHFAVEYAGPVNRRIQHILNPAEFAEAYLEAFVERFSRIQDDYRKRRKAFDALFKYRPRDEAGSFAYRWERVLARMDRTAPRELARLIRENLNIR